MSDFLGVVVAGDLLSTFVRLIEVVIALDAVTLVCMLFARAKNDV